MRVFLVDGTYELFRHYYGVPPHRTADGAEVGATRGVLWSMLRLLEQGVTHLGVATDHVIESFRNGLWAGYKSSAGPAPRTRTSASASAAPGWCSWTGAAGSSTTRPGCGPSSGSARPPSPTTWPWSATRPTATRGCP